MMPGGHLAVGPEHGPNRLHEFRKGGGVSDVGLIEDQHAVFSFHANRTLR